MTSKDKEGYEVPQLSIIEIDRLLDRSIIVNLTGKLPYFSYIVNGMNLVYITTKDYEPLSLSINNTVNNLTLHVGIDGISKIVDSYKQFSNKDEKIQNRITSLLLHEVFHVIFQHVFEYNNNMIVNKEVYSMAADMACNNEVVQCFKEHSLSSELGDVFSSDYGLESDLTAMNYYTSLIEMLSNEDKKNNNTTSKKSKEDSGGGSKSVSDEINNGRHKSWEDAKDFSSDVIDNINENNKRTLMSAYNKLTSKQKGDLPGNISDHIEQNHKAKGKPTLNWKHVLHTLISNSKLTVTKSTRKRPNRRYGGYEPGRKTVTKSHLVFIIDTSASVDDDSVRDFFDEIQYAYEADKAKITIIEADTEVTNVWSYEGKWDCKITGRGGTDFTEALKYAYEDLDIKPNMIAYLTDGYAGKPNIRLPNNINLLWILCKEGSADIESMKDYGGRCVKMMN